MFIYSVRSSTLKFFGAVALSLLVLVTLLVCIEPVSIVTGAAGAESIVYTGADTREGRIAFLAQYGWEVDPDSESASDFTIPAEFDRVMLGYNALQDTQGLDLGRYRKKTVTRYTYTVKNYEGYDGTVHADLIVYRGRVIGGDICSADPSGFVHGFAKPTAE